MGMDKQVVEQVAEQIRAQLKYTLDQSNFPFLGPAYIGKVRDCYAHDGLRVLVTSDRLSCFDRVVTSVPFKGQVLNAIANYWFSLTSDVITNHIVDTPHPNVMIVKNCEILPVEVVLRAYIAGGGWREYEATGEVSGVKLPSGMKQCQALPAVTITPSIKAPKGTHDEPISEAEVVKRGLVPGKLWDEVRERALALFEIGARESAKRGLILVDTKYEFGLHQGKLILADEIHTLDSSRYWRADSYPSRMERGEMPVMLDKEPIRQWLIGQGFKGDGPIPSFSDDYRVSLAKHYLDSAELIIGHPLSVEVGNVAEAIERCLRNHTLLQPRKSS